MKASLPPAPENSAMVVATTAGNKKAKSASKIARHGSGEAAMADFLSLNTGKWPKEVKTTNYFVILTSSI